MLSRSLPFTTISFSWGRSGLSNLLTSQTAPSLHSLFVCHNKASIIPLCSSSPQIFVELTDSIPLPPSKQGPIEPGLYLVRTPIENLEDITLQALRVLISTHVILSENTRHSGKLLHHYSIKTSLMSYHKFNEAQMGQTILKR
ncbi:hypothetical protein ACFX2B_019747 [Malus domestica]